MDEKNPIWKKVLSDENIYMAIYSLENSLQNKELVLEKELNKYRDIYNQKNMLELIEGIRNRIKELEENENFLRCKVFFKPKENDKGIIKFRPIHQYEDLEDAIAAIAMLNVILYEFDDICMECKKRDECKDCRNEKNNKIILSNISRLIPSNFYGNSVSMHPSRIYDPWQSQYREYVAITSERFLRFHNTREYAYEIDIDIKDFFPSIDPRYVIAYILEKLPVYMEENEKKAIKIILEKLLFVEIINDIDEIEAKELWFGKLGYYNKEKYKGRPNGKKYTLGVPQGLVQSYFFANIFMIEVAQIYAQVFKGESFFYVDDSVIFTNEEVNGEDVFKKKIIWIENQVGEVTKNYIEKYQVDNEQLRGHIKKAAYHLELHKDDEKSSFISILEPKTGEIHLSNLCRAASQTTVDLNNSFSDNEDVTLRERIQKMLEEVCNEINFTDEKIKELQLKKDVKNNDIIFMLKNYKKKLFRYKKFFKYREMILRFREKMEFKDIYDNIIQKYFTEKEEMIDAFFKNFDEDILLAAISFSMKYAERAIDKEEKEKYINEIEDYWKKINKELFGFENKNSSYLYQVYYKIAKNEERIERFSALEKLLMRKYPDFQSAHDEVREKYVNILLSKEVNLEKEHIFDNKFLKAMAFVYENSSDIYKDVINGRISNIFNVKFDDSYNFSKRENRMLTYKELRLLSYVRNYRFDITKFERKRKEFRMESVEKIDYSLLEVMKCFRLFVKEPDRIDDLIKIHQYTCDVWKNGSKYLYFYTLHNQEHAVQLIKNCIEIIKSIYFIKISKLDYYILFIACYLHDISMVTIPSLELFNNKNSEANIISTDFLREEGRMTNDSAMVKNLLVRYYRKLDEFYEKQVRDTHAYKSGQEIRKRKDLDFIELCTREVVAEVAEAHGFDVNEVYKSKSVASEKMYSKKFMQIILRLADLLDISSYRISKPILSNNLENMSAQSSFHWISHIMTDGYKIKVTYTDNGKKPMSEECKSYLQPKRIIENFKIEIYVNISQFTKESAQNCRSMRMEYDKDNRCKIELRSGMQCSGEKCNFLCKWLTKKNKYLFDELEELQRYLNDNENNYYYFKASVVVVAKNNQVLSPKQFDIIKNEIRKK